MKNVGDLALLLLLMLVLTRIGDSSSLPVHLNVCFVCLSFRCISLIYCRLIWLLRMSIALEEVGIFLGDNPRAEIDCDSNYIWPPLVDCIFLFIDGLEDRSSAEDRRRLKAYLSYFSFLFLRPWSWVTSAKKRVNLIAFRSFFKSISRMLYCLSSFKN